MTTVIVILALLAVMLTTYDLAQRIGAREERRMYWKEGDGLSGNGSATGN